MSNRIELPTKAQIAAITDPAAVRSLLEAVENAVATIETQMACNPQDHSWRGRAGRALMLHKKARHQLSRRLNDLGLEKLGRKGRKQRRPESDNDALTNQALADGVAIDTGSMKTADDINAALEWLLPRIEAVEKDRSDELDLPDAKRDQKFLSAANTALKAMRIHQNTLMSKRGLLKRASVEERQSRRERLFIDLAKETLPEETFKMLWARVDEQGQQLQGREIAA